MLNKRAIFYTFRGIVPNAGFSGSLGRLYSKPAVILNKFINKSKAKRREWRDFELTSRPGITATPGVVSNKGPHDKTRVTVLNKLFMRYITDLMATGNCSEKIIGLGVDVTKVKTSGDYSIVNVYWVSHGSVEESAVEKALSKAAGPLREELTLLRVVGRVPTIQFVRDRSQASWTQVENLLKVADMGEDYEPKGAAKLKEDFGNETTTTPLPQMRQNVLGVDREGILESILSNMKGGKSDKNASARESVQYQQFDQEAFATFLRQRRIQREKHCRDSSFQDLEPDDNNEDVKFSEDEDDDYLEEDFEEKKQDF